MQTELLRLLKQEPRRSADRLSLYVGFDRQVRTNLDSTLSLLLVPIGEVTAPSGLLRASRDSIQQLSCGLTRV